MSTSTNVLCIRNCRELQVDAMQTLQVHSPDDSTFLHGMTSWPPY